MNRHDQSGARVLFKRHLEVLVYGDDRVVIREGLAEHSIDGSLPVVLAPLLDGRFSRDQVVDTLADTHNPLEIRFALDRLETLGLVHEEPAPFPPAANIRDHLGVAPEIFRERLARRTLRVGTMGSVSRSDLEARLQEIGLNVDDDAGRTLLLAENFRDAYRELANDPAAAGSGSLLMAGIDASSLWVGPIFGPDRRACPLCTAARVNASPSGVSPDSSAVQVSAVATFPSLRSAALDLIAVTALRWCAADETPDLEDHLTTFDLTTLDTQRHTVVPRPGCPRCRERQHPKHLALPTALTTNRPIAPDTLRSRSPDRVWASVRHLVSPITGVVEPPVPHGRNFAGEVNIAVAAVRDARDPIGGRRGLRSRCAGTGQTAEAARLGAVCEAVERASGLAHGDENFVRAAQVDLSADAVDPTTCLLFSDLQYADRERWNRNEAGGLFVPQPFDPRRSTDWSPVWSLRDRRLRYLPAALCYYDWPRDDDHDFCRADSNGCASGTTLEEAILHGLFELVERDAAAIWWYNRLQRPRVDLESFDDPMLRVVPGLCRRLGLDCEVLDLTTDIGIPAFVALASSGEAAQDDPVPGFGAHLSARTALRRALFELSQLAANRRPQSTPARFFTEPPSGPYLRPDPTTAARTSQDFPRHPSADLRSILNGCVAVLAQRGLDVLVLDQSRACFDLRTARTVIPGLRSFWPRLAAGRLYDLPVDLGWRDRPISEAEVNPSHLML